MLRISSVIVTLSLAIGCQTTGNSAQDQNQLSAMVDALRPQGIQIENFTQPISRDGDGRPDAIEVILAARDSAGYPTKAVGTFQFELYTRRTATTNPEGERLSYWRMDLHDGEAIEGYWDNFARYYRFPLELEALQAGDYILTAQYTDPTGRHLFDVFDLDFNGDSVPALEAGY